MTLVSELGLTGEQVARLREELAKPDSDPALERRAKRAALLADAQAEHESRLPVLQLAVDEAEAKFIESRREAQEARAVLDGAIGARDTAKASLAGLRERLQREAAADIPAELTALITELEALRAEMQGARNFVRRPWLLEYPRARHDQTVAAIAVGLQRARALVTDFGADIDVTATAIRHAISVAAGFAAPVGAA